MTWQAIKHWILPVAREPAAPRVDAGLYHYQRARDGAYVRFHLRVEPDGNGLVIAGAAEAVRLTPAGVYVAKGLLEERNADDLARELGSRSLEDPVRRSVLQVQHVLADLAAPSGRYPIFNLADPSFEDAPHLLAPFQADVELTPGDQRPILARLWEAGVPHVRFRCGAELDATRLIEAVQSAEDLGMIAGVRALASPLAAGELLDRLAGVGLDYVVVPWLLEQAPHNQVLGSGDFEAAGALFARIRRLEMCPVAEIPLFQDSFDHLEAGVESLVAERVENVEVFAVADDSTTATPNEETFAPLAPDELRQMAAWVEDLSQAHPLQIVWAPPVARDLRESITQQVLRGPRTGGDVSIRVDREGNVIPPRGAEIVAGSLLRDPWKTIWEQSAFRAFRGLVERPTHCPQCPGLAICAASCPADPQAWSRSAAEPNGPAGGED